MSKVKVVPIQISNRIISQFVRPILGLLNHLDAISTMKLTELIRVADHKVNGATFGSWRALLQEYLHVTQVNTGKRRRFAFGEGQGEAEFPGIELGGSSHIADRQSRMMLFALDDRRSERTHVFIIYLSVPAGNTFKRD